MRILRRLCLLMAWILGSVAAARGAEGTLRLQHQWAGAPLALDSLRYEVTDGERLAISRVSYLLSRFAVRPVGGDWVELPETVAWMDAGSQRAEASLGALPPGKYEALRFAVGVDPSRNAGDASRWPADHALNPNLNGLHWTWQTGYIFLALEGSFRTRQAPVNGWSYHLARDPFLTPITVPLSFEMKSEGRTTIELGFDLAKLFDGLSPGQNGTSTHSRDGDEIAPLLSRNLPRAFHFISAAHVPVIAARQTPPDLDLPEKFTPYRLKLGAQFSVPPLPRDNPLLVERVALGKRLFHEKLLSRDGSLACASCHTESAAFSDPRRFSVGVDGRVGTRNAMPLLNLAWKTAFFWDGRARTLRDQALMPIQDHAEMDESLDRVVAKLTAHPDYRPLFAAAFRDGAITPARLGLALENFLLTQMSYDSKFDRANRGEAALNEEEQRGFELFFTEFDPRLGLHGADCFHCHGGPTFSDHQWHNTGLPDAKDLGRFVVTGVERDLGKFVTPSLRNVALTAPYMHDGRFATLREVITHYVSGVERNPALDPNLAKHPGRGVPLSEVDQAALVAFLRTLTDERFAAPAAGATPTP